MDLPLLETDLDISCNLLGVNNKYLPIPTRTVQLYCENNKLIEFQPSETIKCLLELPRLLKKVFAKTPPREILWSLLVNNDLPGTMFQCPLWPF